MKLRNRLLVTMLTAWALTLVVLGVAIHELLSRRLLAHATAELAVQGQLMHALVGGFLRERERDLAALATDQDISLDPNRLSASYQELIHSRNSGESFQKLRLIAADGHVVVDTDQLGVGLSQPGFDHFALHTMQITRDGLGASLAQMEYPLPGGGWIVGVVPLRRIIEALQLNESRMHDLRIRLIDPLDMVVYDSSERGTIDQTHRAAWLPDRLGSQMTEPIFDGGAAWSIELSVDRTEILNPLNHIRWLVLSLIPISLLMGGLLIWRTSNSLSRPLHLLTKEVQDLSHGGWRRADPTKPPGAWWEVRILHGAIASMTANLRQQFADLTATQTALASKEEQLRLALESSGVGLWDWDVTNGQVTYSATWRLMLGYPHEDLTSGVETWYDLVDPDDLPRVLQVVEQFLQHDDGLYHVEMRCRCHDGSWKWILTSGRVVARDEAGSARRMIGTHVDITSMKQTEAKLGIALAASESAGQAKSEFLAIMSHEIRTPMNGVLGLTSVLLGTKLDANQRDLAETVQSSGEALLAILNDILDLSKIEASRMEMDCVAVDICRAAHDVVALFRGQAAARHLELTFTCAERSLYVVADRNRIRQVLMNLVSNALKFTHQGSVTIRMRRVADQQVAIEIVDTGIGISADQLNKLFLNFSQVDSSLSRRYGGTGLGLIISKRLIEGMGGSISVTSTADVGSVFTILLPQAQVTTSHHSTTAMTFAAQGPVLIADAHPVGQRVMSLMLSQIGLETVAFNDGTEVLTAWRQASYSVVLVNPELPGLDGIGLVQAIRAAEAVTRQAHTPIIAVINHDEHELGQSCLAAGMDEVLVRPFTAEQLTRVLANWIALPQGLTCVGASDKPPS